MPKPKKPIREMHRWEKMMAGATDMEELLVEIYEWRGCQTQLSAGDWERIYSKIERQLKRQGRLK